MKFPEWLYRLLPGDQGSQQLAVIWREASASAAGVDLGTSIYTVPNDKCLVLTNASMNFIQGAGETVARRRLIADPPAGSTRYDILDDEANSATQRVSNGWTGEVVIPAGWRVRVEATYAPGVAVSTVAAEIHGYLIPRGTFVFG